MKRIFTLLLTSSIAAHSYAQTGTPDNTFGTNGKVITPIGAGADYGSAMAIQSDGKIIEAGSSNNGTNEDFALLRYNTNGTPDNTFGTNGKVTTAIGTSDENINAIAIQSDGKIVAAGFTFNGTDKDFAIARYNTDGTLDNTFGTGGKVITTIGTSDESISAIAIQSDGKIVVAGSANSTIIKSDFAVVRYNSNGTPDNTFGTNGKTTTAIGNGNDGILAIAIEGNGKLVVSGFTSGANFSSDFAVARYTTTGVLDNTFGTGGKVITIFGSGSNGGNGAYSVALQKDGKIVVGGDSANSDYITFALARYNNNGTLDNSFGGDGKVTTAIGTLEDFVRSIDLQSDGKIVAAGITLNPLNFSADFALARYNTDGSLDNTFDTDGKATLNFGGNDDMSAMKLSGSRIYAAGTTNVNGTNDFALAAFGNDGTALPLSIISFNAAKQNTMVQLTWKLADVGNAKSFEIERSTTGQSFIKVGTVKATPNNTTESVYAFSDPVSAVKAVTVFYRLKMLGADGRSTYSNVIPVKLDAMVTGLHIIGNPVKEVLYIQATGTNEAALVQVVDAAGRILKQEKVQLNSTTSISLNVESIAAGNYYLLFQTGSSKQVQPFVKQ